MPKTELITELSNKAVLLGQGELTLDSLREAVVALGEKGVEGYAKVVVNQPARSADSQRWSVVATWDPEKGEF